MRVEKLKSILETKHLSIPIRLTYYVDFFLESFPRLMDRWEKGKELKPTIVVIGPYEPFLSEAVLLTRR